MKTSPLVVSKQRFLSSTQHRTTIPSSNLRQLSKLKKYWSMKKSFWTFFCFLTHPPLIFNSKNLSQGNSSNRCLSVHYFLVNRSRAWPYLEMEAPQESYGNMPNMLCCLCGVDITYNPASMCTSCLQNEIDITSNLRTTLTIHSCRGCGRYEVSTFVQEMSLWVHFYRHFVDSCVHHGKTSRLNRKSWCRHVWERSPVFQRYVNYSSILNIWLFFVVNILIMLIYNCGLVNSNVAQAHWRGVDLDRTSLNAT